MMRIKELNANGISVTVNNLGEFISDEAVATKAKEEILNLIDVELPSVSEE